MEKLNAYKETIENQSQLLSTEEVLQVIDTKETIESSTKTIKLWHKKSLAFAASVAVLLTLVFLIPKDNTSTNIEGELSYFDYRYTNYVETAQDDPSIYDSKIINTIKGNNRFPSHLSTLVEPSPEALQKIGFIFDENNVYYEANVNGHGYINIGVKDGRASVIVGDNKKPGVRSETYYPAFMSDMAGRQGVKYRFGSEDSEKMKTNYFEASSSSLIPIVVKVGVTYPSKREKMIFWFSPSDRLFEILENEKINSQNMVDAYQKLIKTYLEMSDLLKKNSLTLYPNPASEQVNLVTHSNNKISHIKLMDINGTVVKNNLSFTKFEDKASKSYYKVNIQDVNNGVYLLEIITNDSSKPMVKRVIVRN